MSSFVPDGTCFMFAPQPSDESLGLLSSVPAGRGINVSSPLKKPPGEGTGPTIYAHLRGNLVGRVPSHGEHDLFERAVSCLCLVL